MSTGQVKGTLPFTGLATLPLVALGLVLSGGGALMTRMRLRPGRKSV